MNFSHSNRWLTCLVLLGSLLGVSACATNNSFDRHNLSRLWVDDESGKIFFDATVSPQYPRDSEAAEEERAKWVEEWLKVRNQCLSGHEIVNRRVLGRHEDSVYRHHLRYEVTCVSDKN